MNHIDLNDTNSLKDDLKYLSIRLYELRKKPYLSYQGNSGFICQKNREWYKYRGEPNLKGEKHTYVHLLFIEVVYLDKFIVHDKILKTFSNGMYDDDFIIIYQNYKNALFETTTFLEFLDLEIDEQSYLITYEQIINMIEFCYSHLSLLNIDLNFLTLSDNDKEEYLKSFELLSMLQYRKAPLMQVLRMGQLYTKVPYTFLKRSESILNNEEILKLKDKLTAA